MHFHNIYLGVSMNVPEIPNFVCKRVRFEKEEKKSLIRKGFCGNEIQRNEREKKIYGKSK